MSLFFDGLIKVIIFGESHGEAIGGVIEGFPSGVNIDYDFINAVMKRRAPNASFYSTGRIENDNVRILSGVYEGKTSGTPIAFVIENNDMKSADYKSFSGLIRPSHADYTQILRYKGFADLRGGGHFSGRLTAPMVFAGALCKLWLNKFGVNIVSHIREIGGNKDKTLIDFNEYDEVKNLQDKKIPLIDGDNEKAVIDLISGVKADGDSIGAVIECGVYGVKAGLGGTMLNSLESKLSGALFAVPAVKGVEFGRGFGFTEGRGSQFNDEFTVKDGEIRTKNNNNGGILGGITDGMPLIFSVVFKPTPSIYKEQNTVNINKMSEEKLTINGRHDPCVALRAVPVVESAAAVCLCNLYLEAYGYYGA